MRRWLLLFAVTLQLSAWGQDAFEFRCPGGHKLSFRTTSESTVEVIQHLKKPYIHARIVIPEEVKEKGVTYKVTAINGAFQDYTSLKEVVIPNTVVSIGDFSFKGCTSLTRITIPNSVREIGRWAFERCTMLKTLDIPAPVEHIGDFAFEGCTTLQKVTFPSSLKSIGRSAFRYCSRLVNVEGLNPDVLLGEDVFFLCAFAANGQKETPQPSPSVSASQPVKTEPQQTKPPVQMVRSRSVDADVPATTVSNDYTFAVIIGNEKYAKVADVPYASNDAKMMAEYCRRTLGIPAQNIRQYDNVTFGAMLTAMSDIKNIADAYEGNLNVIFYYAGHGVPNEATRDAYIMPVDADGQHTEACYPVSRLYKELEELKANNVVVFMDACFS